MKGMHDTCGIYHEPLFVEFRDTDRDKHIRLSTWLAWLANLAGYDYEVRGLSRDELLQRGQVFLINRFSLRIRRTPRLYEELMAATWEHGTEMIYFLRDYAFETPQGERIADARRSWLLCDPVRHRILRPRELKDEVRSIDRAIDCPPLTQLTAPAEMTLLGQRRISYTDLDANNHVYCANYGNIIADYLPDTLVTRPVSTFEITYVKEALLSETLDISGAFSGDAYIMLGRHADGTDSFITRLTFMD